MERAIALEKAKEFVERIDPPKNDRGYPSGDPKVRLEMILKVADWLNKETDA